MRTFVNFSLAAMDKVDACGTDMSNMFSMEVAMCR